MEQQLRWMWKWRWRKNKTLSVEEYLNKTRPYLKDIMRNPKNSKTQVMIAVNFTSSKYNDEEHVMHSKSDNIEIKINHKEDEVIEKFSVTFF